VVRVVARPVGRQRPQAEDVEYRVR
jgi:hypothetical protein